MSKHKLHSAKRPFAVVLALLMAFTLLPVMAWAEEDVQVIEFNATGELTQAIVKSTLTDVKGPYSAKIGSGVTSIGVEAFYMTLHDKLMNGKIDLVGVDFTAATGLTTIGARAFKECGKLAAVTFPAHITTIGANAFEGCESLKALTIPNTLTQIGTEAFKSCHELTTLTLQNGHSAYGESVFGWCYGLKSVTIPNTWATVPVKMFQSCENLETVVLGSNTTSLGAESFKDRHSLQTMYKSGTVKETGVVKLEGITVGSKALSSQGVSTIDITGWTSVPEYAFENCYGLTEVRGMSAVTIIHNNAFTTCHSLANITLPSGLVAIGYGAFWNTAIEEITIPASVADIGGFAFYKSSTPAAPNVPAYTAKPMKEVTFEGNAPARYNQAPYNHGYAAATPFNSTSTIINIPDGATGFNATPWNVYRIVTTATVVTDASELISGLSGTNIVNVEITTQTPVVVNSTTAITVSAAQAIAVGAVATLSLTDNSSLTVNVNGRVEVEGTLSVGSTLTVNGTMDISGELEVSGELTVNGASANVTVNDLVIDDGAEITIEQGTMTLSNSLNDNSSTATLTVGRSSLFFAPTSAIIGVPTAKAPARLVVGKSMTFGEDLAVLVRLDGDILVKAGATLTILGNLTNNGKIILESGAKLDISNATYTSIGEIVGASSSIITNGDTLIGTDEILASALIPQLNSDVVAIDGVNASANVNSKPNIAVTLGLADGLIAPGTALMNNQAAIDKAMELFPHVLDTGAKPIISSDTFFGRFTAVGIDMKIAAEIANANTDALNNVWIRQTNPLLEMWGVGGFGEPITNPGAWVKAKAYLTTVLTTPDNSLYTLVPEKGIVTLEVFGAASEINADPNDNTDLLFTITINSSAIEFSKADSETNIVTEETVEASDTLDIQTAIADALIAIGENVADEAVITLTGSGTITLNADIDIPDNVTLVVDGTLELIASPGNEINVEEGGALVIESDAKVIVKPAATIRAAAATLGFNPALVGMTVNDDVTIIGALDVKDGAVVIVANGKKIIGTATNITLNTTGRIANTDGSVIAHVDASSVRTYTGGTIIPAANAPVIVKAEINGTKLTLVFNSDLSATAGTFDKADFTVDYSATADPTVVNIAISGKAVTLTLSSAPESTDTVKVAYQPYGGRNIKGTNGVNISAFYNQNADNLTRAYAIVIENAATGLIGQTCDIKVTPTEGNTLQSKILIIQIYDAGKTSLMAVELANNVANSDEIVTISYANKAGIIIDVWLVESIAIDMSGELDADAYLANAQFITIVKAP